MVYSFFTTVRARNKKVRRGLNGDLNVEERNEKERDRKLSPTYNVWRRTFSLLPFCSFLDLPLRLHLSSWPNGQEVSWIHFQCRSWLNRWVEQMFFLSSIYHLFICSSRDRCWPMFIEERWIDKWNWNHNYYYYASFFRIIANIWYDIRA